jgi:hypothetical protein
VLSGQSYGTPLGAVIDACGAELEFWLIGKDRRNSQKPPAAAAAFHQRRTSHRVTMARLYEYHETQEAANNTGDAQNNNNICNWKTNAASGCLLIYPCYLSHRVSSKVQEERRHMRISRLYISCRSYAHNAIGFIHIFMHVMWQVWPSEEVEREKLQFYWLYCRPSDRRLSAKLVLMFADGECRVVSATDTYGRILDILYRNIYNWDGEKL